MRNGLQFAWFTLLALSTPAADGGQEAFAKKPVSVSITASETAKLGSPVIVHIVLRGESAVPVTVPQQRHSGNEGEFNYQVFVTLADGVPVRDTEYGNKIRTHSLVRGFASSMVKQLHQGEEIRENVDITSLVKLDLLGTYIVQVERDSPPPLNVRSNSVTIRIVP